MAILFADGANPPQLPPVTVAASHAGYASGAHMDGPGTCARAGPNLAMEQPNRTRATDLPVLEKLLKQATVYNTDIARESPYFEAVQWAGLSGLLSDL
ncbi:MAG: hypothetical protein SFV51_08835 [Bryobacteraceae bacterium]|nr:hypothetical protein [Bryobacteraceae bacterium]